MQKFQLGLIAMLICCVAFISCERTQKMLAPAEPVEEAMPTDMTDMMDMMADYMSWAKVELPAHWRTRRMLRHPPKDSV